MWGIVHLFTPIPLPVLTLTVCSVYTLNHIMFFCFYSSLKNYRYYPSFINILQLANFPTKFCTWTNGIMQDDPRETNHAMVHRYNMTKFTSRRPPYPYAGPQGHKTFQEHYCFNLYKGHTYSTKFLGYGSVNLTCSNID